MINKWINSKERFSEKEPQKPKPTIDPEISKIVGHPVAVNDPRLIQEVIKWKQYNTSEDKPDRHLDNSAKRNDLRRIFQEKKHQKQM